MSGIQPNKRLGQHFLHDRNLQLKIVHALRADAGARVVEIGPGTGALTTHLAERFERFLAIEVDERAVAYLDETLPGVDVRHVDVLKVDWPAVAAEGAGPLHVIGNLPYNITSPIVFDLLDHDALFAEAVLMMQREVAERLVAGPGSKTYGILSVLVQLQADAELLFNVSRNVFFPKPDVESSVVRLTFRRHEALAAGDEVSFLRTVVRTAFNQRRKTLRNSLRALTSARGVELPESVAGLRPETLSPADFVALARHLAPVIHE
ncbi:MAG: 16S rRNA (adenine(1518)-N(6)/adenine(1519)-N(6))-dimethyltransferase RsmA [Rhodothermales bacterium]